MSGSCVIPLLHDYDVKVAKLHTFKLKCDDNTEKETFDINKSDGTTIEILFNTVLLRQTMTSRI
jgi:chemotaxis receptor (MCP) glutamine deamidase CheD